MLAQHNKGVNDIYGNICANKCSEGTFVDSETNACEFYCDSSCNGCTQPENKEVCTSCSSNIAYLSSNPGSNI